MSNTDFEREAAPTQTTVPKMDPIGSTMDSRLPIFVASLTNTGKREYQQDSLGVAPIDNGMLAVVADGMGGLTGGEKVSQLLIRTFLTNIKKFAPGYRGGCLYSLLSYANREVNQMLGPDGIYKSGSTLLSVLLERFADKWMMQWVSVGDSRIYLYRGGSLIQINREHNYQKELLLKAVRGEIPFSEVASDSNNAKLTSFVGMGELRYVDGSIRSTSLLENDVVMLMSDGVFNTISEEHICAILRKSISIKEAAAELEKMVLVAENPHQDNFTAVLLRIGGNG